jgi:hypothetical protein
MTPVTILIGERRGGSEPTVTDSQLTIVNNVSSIRSFCFYTMQCDNNRGGRREEDGVDRLVIIRFTVFLHLSIINCNPSTKDRRTTLYTY